VSAFQLIIFLSLTKLAKPDQKNLPVVENLIATFLLGGVIAAQIFIGLQIKLLDQLIFFILQNFDLAIFCRGRVFFALVKIKPTPDVD
jgi:hypothetical protein